MISQEINNSNSLYFGRGARVQGVVIHCGGLEIVRSFDGEVKSGYVTRGEVTQFTKKSRDRLAWVCLNTVVKFRSMITLTYSVDYPLSGREAKRHLRAFLQALRRIGPGGDYLWFLEFQKRGAPHYHILWSCAITASIRQKLAVGWVNIVLPQERLYCCLTSKETRSLRDMMLRVHCHPGSMQNERRPGGLVRYAVKYASKLQQKDIPSDYRDVGRLWGHSRGVSVEPLGFLPMNETELRDYLWQVRPEMCKWDYLPKYVFVDGMIPTNRGVSDDS